MKPYLVVTEGQSNILLLQAILNIRQDDPQIAFFAAGGWSSADSYARTRLMLNEANVAVVVNADTFKPEEAEGRRQFLHRSLGDVTINKKYSVTVIAPEIEALWFREPCLLEQLVCRPVSEVEMMKARYEPKKVLERLLRPVYILKAYSSNRRRGISGVIIQVVSRRAEQTSR